jgi:hypothetical protein
VHPAYARLLELTRDQADALARGDLDGALALLGAREQVLSGLPDAGQRDADAIREILRLDRDLSSHIRERMIDIRNEAAGGQHGRAALSGYRPAVRRSARAIDTAG